MTGELAKNFHGVGIGPLSKILAVKVIITQLRYDDQKRPQTSGVNS